VRLCTFTTQPTIKQSSALCVQVGLTVALTVITDCIV